MTMLTGLPLYMIGAAVESPKQKVAPAGLSHTLKSAACVASGIGLGLMAYIATELPIVLLHEYGHHLGNILTGGKGGRIELESNLHHPLGLLMPFSGCWNGPEKGGNEIAVLAAGPVAGLAVNYAIMAASNAYYAKENGATKEESVRAGFMSPLNTFKDVRDGVADIVAGRNNKAPTLSKAFITTFNILRASRLFGEFVYGLTPVSVKNGDGQKYGRSLALKKI